MSEAEPPPDFGEIDTWQDPFVEAFHRLRALLAEARAVLEPFALADNLDSKIVGTERLRLLRGCTSLADFRAARSLVARIAEEGK